MGPTTFSNALEVYRRMRANVEETASHRSDDESRKVGKACDDALGCLIAAPSDTVADLATKLETMLVEYEDSDWDEDRVRLIAADARRLAKTPEQTAWWALVDRLSAVEASQPVTQESIDDAGELIGQIMATPAPDAAAVRWKLDYILDASGGSSASYAADYLQQLVADYRRALGEA
jgi:hypothetical protein